MDALACIAGASSLVQLVEFSGRCVSGTVKLCRSADGVLDGNAAIELAVNHLILRKEEVQAAASSVTDASLQRLCIEVGETSSQLLDVLQKLKVRGNNSKWKSMRKAIRSVWSKQKVADLEHRLGNFRNQLNLHTVVKTRLVSS
jgi:hypothetical protein